MRTLYFAVFTAVYTILLPTGLYAQDPPAQISDFNYGRTSENIITGLDTVDGVLYASFNSIDGETATSLISIIDPETGASTGVLDNELGQRGGGSVFSNYRSVFKVGGMTFAIQRNLSTGTNLYRLDRNTAESIFATPTIYISEPVLFRNELYFLAGDFPVRANAQDQGRIIGKLYKTDGTAEGTVLVNSTFLAISSGFFQLIPGEDKMLIVANEGGVIVFGLYDPASDEVSIVAEGFNQLILSGGRRSVQAPAYFKEGQFCVYGSGSIYRIPEDTGQPQQIDLMTETGGFPNFFYDKFDFLEIAGELYCLGSIESGDKRHLYKIDSPDANTATAQTSLARATQLINLDVNFTVINDTLYYVDTSVDNIPQLNIFGAQFIPVPSTNYSKKRRLYASLR